MPALLFQDEQVLVDAKSHAHLEILAHLSGSQGHCYNPDIAGPHSNYRLDEAGKLKVRVKALHRNDPRPAPTN